MVYNFNLGIGWASSGVEYAQAYRAKVLREIGQEAKFVFTEMFPKDNIQQQLRSLLIPVKHQRHKVVIQKRHCLYRL